MHCWPVVPSQCCLPPSLGAHAVMSHLAIPRARMHYPPLTSKGGMRGTRSACSLDDVIDTSALPFFNHRERLTSRRLSRLDLRRFEEGALNAGAPPAVVRP